MLVGLRYNLLIKCLIIASTSAAVLVGYTPTSTPTSSGVSAASHIPANPVTINVGTPLDLKAGPPLAPVQVKNRPSSIPNMTPPPRQEMMVNESQPTQVTETAPLAILAGTVTKSPTRPVCSFDAPCSIPVENQTIELLDAQSRVVARTQTDGNGNYSFQLAPGTYNLVFVPAIGIPGKGQPTYTVTVATGENNYNIENIDTGMR